MADAQSLSKELDFLRTTFLKNGYSLGTVNQALGISLKGKSSVEENANKIKIHTQTPGKQKGPLSVIKSTHMA